MTFHGSVGVDGDTFGAAMTPTRPDEGSVPTRKRNGESGSEPERCH